MNVSVLYELVYTCMVHLCGTPVWYTCMVHLYGTPVWYTCMVHLYGTAENIVMAMDVYVQG